jgi:hypothetical protein
MRCYLESCLQSDPSTYSTITLIPLYWLTGDTSLLNSRYTVKKKVSHFLVPSHKPNSPWRGIIYSFLARESLVSDITAGDGKIGNLFYSVGVHGNVVP